MIVGHLHNKKQLSVDNEVTTRANPVTIEILERLARIEKKVDGKWKLMCGVMGMFDIFEQVPDPTPAPKKTKRRLAKRGK